MTANGGNEPGRKTPAPPRTTRTVSTIAAAIAVVLIAGGKSGIDDETIRWSLATLAALATTYLTADVLLTRKDSGARQHPHERRSEGNP